MANLIIVRHGQSLWNLENRFTGDVDIDLTPAGEMEAERAGVLLKKYKFDKAYTSVLKRAIKTLDIILSENDFKSIPVIKNASLNERRYGNLQGLNKAETELKYGHDQVLLWRRSYDVVPPGGESLKDTYNRVMPYYHDVIEPGLAAGNSLLIVAHGNSLRALMMFLENISISDIASTNIPTGAPRLYEFNAFMQVVKSLYIN